MAGLLSSTPQPVSSRPVPVSDPGDARGWGGLLGDWWQSQRELWGLPGKVAAGLAEGVRSDPAGAVVAASQVVPVLGDVVGAGADAYRYATDPSSRTGRNYGLTAAGLLPWVPGMAGIFAGTKARTADAVMLQRAADLEAEGADARRIWDETGWFRGPDKLWRFEIDDSQAEYRPGRHEARLREQGVPAEAIEATGYQARVGDVLEHPELFKAYPELAERPLLADPKVASQGYGGRYYPSEDRVVVDLQTSRGLESGKSVLLHELQHGVQERQGYARGGNREQFQGLLPPVVIGEAAQRELQALETALEIQRLAKTSGLDVRAAAFEHARRRARLFANPETGEADPRLERPEREAIEAARMRPLELRAAIRDAKRRAAITPDQAYRRLAGEAEARAIQGRMNMTSEQRRATFPLESYDVPPDQLIIRGGLLGP